MAAAFSSIAPAGRKAEGDSPCQAAAGCKNIHMPAEATQTHRLLPDQLTPGDRVEVAHTVTVGPKKWTTRIVGKVVRTERRRHGLHFRRNFDDKVLSDVILLELPDGELTTVTLDEFTVVRPVSPG